MSTHELIRTEFSPPPSCKPPPHSSGVRKSREQSEGGLEARSCRWSDAYQLPRSPPGPCLPSCSVHSSLPGIS